MGGRKVIVKRSAAESIAATAWFIESKGMLVTADKFTDKVYDFLQSLSDERKSYASCREPQRLLLGYKCVSYRKKYTVVFFETEDEIIITEFVSSKLLHW